MTVRDALDRGFSFVEERGNALDCARAAVLSAGGQIDGVVELIAPLQRENGELCCPETREAGTGIDAALYVLGILDDLRALGVPLLEMTCTHLEAVQSRDGNWFGRVGDSIDDRLFTTGMLAGYLAKTRWARPQMLMAAGDYLCRHWSPDRVKGWNWRGIAAHAHYFANVPHDAADEVLQWCGRELERGFRAQQWGALQTARVLVCCDAHGIPGARVGARELKGEILSEQRGDGGWSDLTAPTPTARVERTLEAMTALAHFSGGRGRP